MRNEIQEDVMCEWISVDDRLPDSTNSKAHDLGRLVVRPNGVIGIEYSHSDWWNKKTAAPDMVRVTHWMPLPEPPE